MVVPVVYGREVRVARDENRWIKGLSPEEAEALKKSYKERFSQ